MSNELVLFQNKVAKTNVLSYFGGDEEKVKKFKRTVVDYVNQNPTLIKGDVSGDSVIEACKKVALFDLTLGGDVDIIRRGNKVGAELRYQAYITLLSRANIPAKANVVYENDTFGIDLATSKITHIPPMKGNRGKPVGFYAMVKVAGEWMVDYMTENEMQEFKKRYVKNESSAWKNSYTEMAKKTILKRTTKPYLYSQNNVEALVEMVQIDNATETNDGETLNPQNTLEEKRAQEMLRFITEEVTTLEALQSVKSQVENMSEEVLQAYDAKHQELSQ